MNNNEYLKAKEGLIVGIDDKDNYYRTDGYQHIFLMAPTGAGKGVAFVIPNLLSWQESVVVHDIKMENYALTSGWRAKQGQKIYLFEPLNAEGKTHCYNPLDFISKNPDKMLDDIQKMANLLIHDHDCCHGQERNLFTALALYVMSDKSKVKSLGEIFRIIMGNLAEELSHAVKKLKLHKTGELLINNFLSKSEKKRSKIISSLADHMELWSNPLVDYATSKSDFNPADFRKEKSTLYVGLHPGDINRLKPLMQFFYQHIAQSLATPPDSKKEPHGVLFMLDEFPSIGKMDIFTSCIPYFRGYKIRLLLIAQDLNDLKGSYCEKGANAILANSSFKIAFTPNNYETANFISNLSVDKIKKEISLSWQDVMSIPSDHQIILADNQQPMISKKLFYYNKPEFKDKMIDPV